MRRHILSLGILLLSGIFLTSLPATSSYAQSGLPSEEWTQGDFALWLVKAADAMSKLPAAATGVDAIKFLNALGITPEGGWKKDEKLTKEFLLSLLGDDSKGAEGLSFEELINKVTDRVTFTVSQWNEGFFSASQANAASTPTP